VKEDGNSTRVRCTICVLPACLCFLPVLPACAACLCYCCVFVWYDTCRQHPEIVAKLAAQLKTYRYYTNASMTAEQLAGYDCAALPSDPETLVRRTRSLPS
jgi:hypothetical protein